MAFQPAPSHSHPVSPPAAWSFPPIPPPTAPLPTPSRPRLKRSHPSQSSAAAAASLSLSRSRSRSRSRQGSNSSVLDPIEEWPYAEGDPAESRPKKRRTVPDHEAFGRLSLDVSPAPPEPGEADAASSTAFPATTTPTSLAFPSNANHPPTSFPLAPAPAPFQPQPLSSPTRTAFPRAPPTSPVHAATSLPLSPQAVPPIPPLFFPSSQFAPPPPQPAVPPSEEITMRPASTSWDLDPHRIYVASLEDEDDEPLDVEEAAGTDGVQVNAYATTRRHDQDGHLLPREILHSLRSSPAACAAPSTNSGSLILYQPPPAFPFPTHSGSAPESAKDRALRERREKNEEEWAEFRRRSEMEERRHDSVEDEMAIGSGDGVMGGMDVDEEL
ncbi:hypothetical protein JCM1841_006008 [Sporobolomyces salmonicolor]